VSAAGVVPAAGGVSATGAPGGGVWGGFSHKNVSVRPAVSLGFAAGGREAVGNARVAGASLSKKPPGGVDRGGCVGSAAHAAAAVTAPSSAPSAVRTFRLMFGTS
jgi:hypothetical protein